jgi:hypothetical protein
MSGGRYNYFYFKVEDELLQNVGAIEEMLSDMKADPERYDPEATQIVEAFRDRLRVLYEEAKLLSTLLHDVEWVASNDYGPDAIKKELETLRGTSWWNNRFNPRNPQGLG